MQPLLWRRYFMLSREPVESLDAANCRPSRDDKCSRSGSRTGLSKGITRRTHSENRADVENFCIVVRRLEQRFRSTKAYSVDVESESGSFEGVGRSSPDSAEIGNRALVLLGGGLPQPCSRALRLRGCLKTLLCRHSSFRLTVQRVGALFAKS